MTTEKPAHEPIRSNWRASVENESNVSLDDLKFIFAQAEKRLDDGIKNFDATTTKSITFITLTATLLTALAAYFFVNFDPSGVFSPKLTTVLICCTYTLWVLNHFISIILPKSYQPVGSFPQDLYTEYFFDKDNEGKLGDVNKSTRELYACELQNYNSRIEENDQANRERLALFNKSAKRIIFMPAIGVATYVVLAALSSFF